MNAGASYAQRVDGAPKAANSTTDAASRVLVEVPMGECDNRGQHFPSLVAALDGLVFLGRGELPLATQ